MTDKTRPVFGAELFIPESLMGLFADLGDDAYDVEHVVSGLVVGQRYKDARGTWAEATQLVTDESAENIIGWYRTAEETGLEMSDADLKRHRSLFGKDRAYAVMIDPSKSSLAFYTVEDGVPVKVRAIVLEGS